MMPDYSKTQNERLWIVDEPVHNVLVQPTANDALVPVPGVQLPPALSEFTRSTERTGTAGVRDLIKRKKKPSAWTIPVYAKFGDKAGAVPTYGLLLKKGLGVETLTPHATLTTACTGTHDDIVYTARQGGTSGNSIRVAYIVAGNNTPLSIVVAGNDITVNVATDGVGVATSIANQVIDAIRNSAAANALVSVALKAGDDGSGIVDAFVMTALAGGTDPAKVTYSLASDVTELSVSIWHFVDNLMRGFRGAVINQVALELSGSDEGKINCSGFAANEVFAGVGALSGAHNNVVTVFQLAAGDARRYQVGPNATDFLYLRINSAEIVKLTAVNYTNDQLTVVRGQLGTTAGTYTGGEAVEPWVPGADTRPKDLIAPITVGSIDIGTLTGLRCISFSMVIDNKLEPRLDEYAEPAATGYRRTGPREVGGSLRAYSRKQGQSLLTDLERELAQPATIKAGSALTALLTVSIPTFRLQNNNLDSGGPEFILDYTWAGLETTTGNDEVTLEMT